MKAPPVKIRVRFCGNCNPYYDVKDLLKKMQKDYPAFEYLYRDEEEWHLILLVNSCLSACLKKPNTTKPIVYVSGYQVNHKNCSPDDLSHCISEAIMNAIKKTSSE